MWLELLTLIDIATVTQDGDDTQHATIEVRSIHIDGCMAQLMLDKQREMVERIQLPRRHDEVLQFLEKRVDHINTRHGLLVQALQDYELCQITFRQVPMIDRIHATLLALTRVDSNSI